MDRFRKGRYPLRVLAAGEDSRESSSRARAIIPLRADLLRDGLRAAVPAGVFSGVPSTLHALLTGRSPLEASIAAGSILMPREQRAARLLIAAIPVHASLSLAWAVALAGVLPRRNPVVEGMLAGLAIAALDLGLIGRRYPRIRALQPLPQVADHVAFGIIAAATLARQEATRR